MFSWKRKKKKMWWGPGIFSPAHQNVKKIGKESLICYRDKNAPVAFLGNVRPFFFFCFPGTLCPFIWGNVVFFLFLFLGKRWISFFFFFWQTLAFFSFSFFFFLLSLGYLFLPFPFSFSFFFFFWLPRAWGGSDLFCFFLFSCLIRRDLFFLTWFFF